MYPRTHPLSHFSRVPDPTAEPTAGTAAAYPAFRGPTRAPAVRATLRAGDVLYLPPFWAHHAACERQCVAANVWVGSETMLRHRAVEQARYTCCVARLTCWVHAPRVECTCACTCACHAHVHVTCKHVMCVCMCMHIMYAHVHVHVYVLEAATLLARAERLRTNVSRRLCLLRRSGREAAAPPPRCSSSDCCSKPFTKAHFEAAVTEKGREAAERRKELAEAWA